MNVGDRIASARKTAGLSQAALADRLNVGQSTIAQWEKGRNEVPLQKLADLAKILDAPLQWLAFGMDAFADPDTSLAIEAMPIYDFKAKRVPIVGKVQAGAWAEAYQFEKEQWEYMTLPEDENLPGIPRYALINEGNSMNRICPPGGIWVFVRYEDLIGQGPTAGNLVIVERHRNDGLVEATVKRFKVGPNRQPILVPDSIDPGFEPLGFDGDTDIETIHVIGKVIQVVIPAHYL